MAFNDRFYTGAVKTGDFILYDSDGFKGVGVIKLDSSQMFYIEWIFSGGGTGTSSSFDVFGYFSDDKEMNVFDQEQWEAGSTAEYVQDDTGKKLLQARLKFA